jgi:hypothetical protein
MLNGGCRKFAAITSALVAGLFGPRMSWLMLRVARRMPKESPPLVSRYFKNRKRDSASIVEFVPNVF